jgi:hypothetical protein
MSENATTEMIGTRTRLLSEEKVRQQLREIWRQHKSQHGHNRGVNCKRRCPNCRGHYEVHCYPSSYTGDCVRCGSPLTAPSAPC